jgi:hypothetical protein
MIQDLEILSSSYLVFFINEAKKCKFREYNEEKHVQCDFCYITEKIFIYRISNYCKSLLISGALIFMVFVNRSVHEFKIHLLKDDFASDSGTF